MELACFLISILSLLLSSSSSISTRWRASWVEQICCVLCSSSSLSSPTAKLSTEVGTFLFFFRFTCNCNTVLCDMCVCVCVKNWRHQTWSRLLFCCFFFLPALCSPESDRDDRFSVRWVVVSLSLCAVAMLCKEQGITVLVRSRFIFIFLYVCVCV